MDDSLPPVSERIVTAERTVRLTAVGDVFTGEPAPDALETTLVRHADDRTRLQGESRFAALAESGRSSR